MLVAALAVTAVAVKVIVFEDARLSGRTPPRPPREPGPFRRAVGARSRLLGHWLHQRGGAAWAATGRLRARARAEMARHARPRPEWLRRWSAQWEVIDVKAQALVEQHTPLRRPDPPVPRPADPPEALPDQHRVA